MSIKLKTDLYLSIWRQANSAPVSIPFPTYKAANAFRLRLYVAIRPFRHEENGDPELHLAVNQMEAVASRQPDDSGLLVIRKAEMNEELARIAREAGIPWGVDNQASESMERMQRMLEASEASEASEEKSSK
jgi:hypothetical protein